MALDTGVFSPYGLGQKLRAICDEVPFANMAKLLMIHSGTASALAQRTRLIRVGVPVVPARRIGVSARGHED